MWMHRRHDPIRYWQHRITDITPNWRNYQLFIENPQSGKLKSYNIDKPYYDVDYCKYADWGYRKRTRVWTNAVGFVPKTCKKDCNSMVGDKHMWCTAFKRNIWENRSTAKVQTSEINRI